MKFGGTSLGTDSAIRSALALINEYSKANEVVVVASAFNGVTNSIIEAANRASQGDRDYVSDFLKQLRARHESMCKEIVSGKDELEQTLTCLDSELRQVEKALKGVRYLAELTPRSRDYILSFGERLSTLILASAFRDLGIPARRFTGSEAGIVTNASFGEATPLMDITKRQVRERLDPLLKKRTVPVVAGFIAATKDGVPTTLGRGASDYSATIIGVALEADEIWIWTDVDGLMTADPKIEPAAKTIAELSFMEAMEMSHFAVKAMHPRALEPAAEEGLPVRVKNTFNPDGPSTLILQEQRVKSGNVVKAVTSVREASMITISGAGMYGAPGTAAKVFRALGENKINVLMISASASEASISVIIARSSLERAVTALKESLLGSSLFKDVTAESDVSVVAAVGAGMKGTPGIAARVFRAVAERGVNVRMIAQGSSELNISFVVRQDDMLKSAQALHEEFQLNGEGTH
jgi:aspartate kinase